MRFPVDKSPVPFQRCDGIESSSKEIPEDGLSAGCFTLDTRTNWKPECRVPTSFPAAETEIKPEVAVFHGEKKMPSLWKLSDNIFAGRGVGLKGICLAGVNPEVRAKMQCRMLA
ncbi:hypothetical protein D5086_022218 [Populus alba]|uniref:Uncharacterized protein n=1 Tax=Populus alba TaxID=43335 RepID=A0ACC4BEB9_POPAL